MRDPFLFIRHAGSSESGVSSLRVLCGQSPGRGPRCRKEHQGQRNTPTSLMKELNYGKNYKYAHDYEGNFVKQDFLPDELLRTRIWEGQHNAAEDKLIERMKHLWGERYS